MTKKKRELICKMKVIKKIQMMWNAMSVKHEMNTNELLELTYDQLWEIQMDIGYDYMKLFNTFES